VARANRVPFSDPLPLQEARVLLCRGKQNVIALYEAGYLTGVYHAGVWQFDLASVQRVQAVQERLRGRGRMLPSWPDLLKGLEQV
jgi:hypothetical protein